MSNEAIDTLLYFLRRLYVPQGEQAVLLRAMKELESLRHKEKPSHRQVA
jgi:hypothetical protein